MRIWPRIHFISALVFMMLLSSCTSVNPVDPVQPEDTHTPLPPLNPEHNTSTEVVSTTQISQLTPGVQEMTGVVLSGGDQTPEGLLGGPRVFAYQVQLDSGEVITLTYTAYPPSPAGDAEPKPELNFHDGTIKPGDRFAARGTYDPTTNTLTVTAETDFIETFDQ